jgi:radical SAM protein with 4Fe4S-binding SPASM domain
MSENSLTNLIPKRNDAILAYRTFDNQVAIVDLVQGTLNLLNTTAARIWQLIGERRTPKKIAEKISREFDMSLDKVMDDIKEMLQEMALRGWINGFPSRERSDVATSSDGTEIFEALREQAVRKQIPLVAHIDLTYRCNLRCVHCYLTEGKKQLECSTEEIKDILEQIAEAGTLYLTLSGGEIFLRKDLPEIVRHARKLHFAVRLLTSGTLIDEGMIDEIAEWHPELVAFSVYDLDPGVHDAITKRKGSLSKTLKIISALKERGVPIKISSVLMQSNINGYRRLYSFAKEIGAQFQVDYRITPKTDGSQAPLRYHITDQQARQVLGDPIFSKEYESDPDPLQGYSGVFNEIPCGAAHMSCYISPYGVVTPCIQVPMECGSLRERSFSEIWSGSPELKAFRAIRFSDIPKCANCKLFAYCRPCPGLNLVETGSLFTPPPRVCKEAEHMRTLNKKRR